MIQGKIIALRDRMEDALRSLLGQLTPDTRVAVILILILVFGAASIYMTVSSIYNMGKNEGQRMEIEHIKGVELQKKEQQDSINLFKEYEYDEYIEKK